jgi:hypothetical protein
LYNVADASCANLTAILTHRSEQFRNTPRTIAAIDTFARRMQTIEPQERPFPQFHHCPFIGLIGTDDQRVGCLLHPMAQGNGGVDFRGLSYYGALACRTYFCPTTHQLPVRFKLILRALMDHWYAYGLVVTESALLNAIFNRVEAMLHRPLEPAFFKQHPIAAKRLIDLLQLKIEWPYRPPQANTPCHHFFFDAGYEKPSIDYTALGVHPSPYDDILVELVSRFQRADELTDAETRIDFGLKAVASALQSAI